MPNIGDTVPPEFIPASPEELQRLVGRNTIGGGVRAQNGRARPPRGPRKTPHTATQAASTAAPTAPGGATQ